VAVEQHSREFDGAGLLKKRCSGFDVEDRRSKGEGLAGKVKTSRRGFLGRPSLQQFFMRCAVCKKSSTAWENWACR